MKIQFSTSSVAFDEYGFWEHIDKILRRISDDVLLGYDHGSIMDINGNKIGEWEL